MLKVTSSAKSPRIEPGAASTGLVAPISWRAAATASWPSSTIATSGAAGDEGDQLAEERLLGVLFVVPVGDRLVGLHRLQRRDPQALALEAGDHLAGQGALEGVRLYEDQRPAHGRGSFGVVWARRLFAAARAAGSLACRGRRAAFLRRSSRGWRSSRLAPRRSRRALRAWLAATLCRALRRRPLAQRRLAVGAERPARVDRLAAARAGVLEAALALRAAQVVLLDRVLAVGAGGLGQLAHRSSAALISSSRSCASSRNSGGRTIA